MLGEIQISLEKEYPLSILQEKIKHRHKWYDFRKALDSNNNMLTRIHQIVKLEEDIPDIAQAVSFVLQFPHLLDLKHYEKVLQKRNSISLPCLFLPIAEDEYLINFYRAFGADAVIISANSLDAYKMQYYAEMGRDLGMDTIANVSTVSDTKKVIETDIPNLVYMSIQTEVMDACEINKIKEIYRKIPGDRILLFYKERLFRSEIADLQKIGIKDFISGKTA